MQQCCKIDIDNCKHVAYNCNISTRKSEVKGMKLHLFELKNGHIVLDGTIIRGVRECEFSIKENDSLAELSLKMDVRTLRDEFTTQFGGVLDETGKVGKCYRNKLWANLFPNGGLRSVLNKLISRKR